MDNSVQPQASVVPDESMVMPGTNGTPPISAVPTETTSSPTSGNIKPKRKLGPIVATVFGLLLLVGGIGAGLVLVNQRQILNQKAAGTCAVDSQCNGGKCNPITGECTPAAATPGNCSSGNLNAHNVMSCTGTSVVLTSSQFPTCSGSLQGKSYYCPGGLSNGACLQNQTSSGPYSGGQTVDMVALAAGKTCGAIQLDVASNTGADGACGEATYIMGPACGGGTPLPSGGGNGQCTTSTWCTLQTECTNASGIWGGQDSFCTQGSLGPVGRCCLPPGGGGGGGPTPTPTPQQYTCGHTCTQNSDCKQAANGGTSACISGLCQNTQCPGKTIPGANCDCSALNSCGQHCGASVGLCQAGSVCRFTDTACSNINTTQCVPAASLPSGWTTTICPGNNPASANYYVQFNGATPTYSQLQLACQPAASPTPTPTPAPNISCTSVKAYDSNWNLLSAAQLSQLQSGTQIFFTVMGTTTSGTFDKAAFTINGILQTPTSTTKPGSPGEFYMTYTIPAGTTTFTVTAQLHQQQLNQWF